MTVKQIVQALLYLIGVFAFVLAVGTGLDSISEAALLAFIIISLVVGVALIIVYIVLSIRDNARDTRYPIVRYREAPSIPKPQPQPVYDQEEDKG